MHVDVATDQRTLACFEDEARRAHTVIAQDFLYLMDERGTRQLHLRHVCVHGEVVADKTLIDPLPEIGEGGPQHELTEASN